MLPAGNVRELQQRRQCSHPRSCAATASPCGGFQRREEIACQVGRMRADHGQCIPKPGEEHGSVGGHAHMDLATPAEPCDCRAAASSCRRACQQHATGKYGTSKTFLGSAGHALSLALDQCRMKASHRQHYRTPNSGWQKRRHIVHVSTGWRKSAKVYFSN